MSKVDTYCEKKTMKMVEEDNALGYIYDDLIERGIPERFVAPQIFRTFIMSDSYRKIRYSNEKERTVYMSKEVTYCPEKTMLMVEEDNALGCIYDDLFERGIPERFIARQIFNTFIISDSYRKTRYSEV